MKKIFKTLPLIVLLIVATSCSSVRVSTDYDKKADFSNFKTFAFFKTGIDKAEINDIDKRRILRAIQDELMAKGFTKSEDPDILISIFTKSNQRVDVYNNAWGAGAWGWGGWGPWGWGGWGWGPGWGWGWNQPAVSTRTEGVLFVDLINAKKKELIWQGMGKGFLASKPEKKEERIREFVAKIMEQYPPGTEK
ncbi:DUF4136 domain-containing protein [Hyunsoonleella rubra]|uniref:DUF4136 domain-containing protein n=1 Tax=Hyunsoonleella rubra TaxID=1737062 RepID=A0ABW5TA62_9FLAO